MVNIKIDTTIKDYKDNNRCFTFKSEIIGAPIDVMQELALTTEEILNKLATGNELHATLNKILYQNMLSDILN